MSLPTRDSWICSASRKLGVCEAGTERFNAMKCANNHSNPSFDGMLAGCPADTASMILKDSACRSKCRAIRAGSRCKRIN